MPRKGHVPKREVMPDPIYQDKVITKLINNIMLDGKRGIAQGIVYDAFETIKEQTGEDALEVFYKALNNVMPVLKIKARRIGGATYQVPIEVRAERRRLLCALSKSERVVEDFLIGTMQVENFTTYFKKKRNTAIIVGGDRSDVQFVALEGECRYSQSLFSAMSFSLKRAICRKNCLMI